MANLKDTSFSSTGFLQLPSGNETTGASGQFRYNANSNNIEWYSTAMGGTWTTFALPWAARDVQTVGYNQGGYAASTVWNNTTKLVYATDTSSDLGDNSQEAGHNYQSCGFNNRYAFTWGAGNAHCTAASNVICFDMITETKVTSGYTRNWPYSHVNNGTIMNEIYYCYVTSGYSSGAVYEWNLTTLTLGSQYGTSGESWGAWTENYGTFYNGGTSEHNFMYSTKTAITRGSSTGIAGDNVQHNMQTRGAFTIAGREGNPSTNWRLTNYLTSASYNAIGAKPAVSGEENMCSARDWGYCMGFYNGTHVNTSYKVNYTTWAGATGTTFVPRGKTGNSSATNAWRP